MATYEGLVNKVLSWSNRDIEVFGGNPDPKYNEQLKDFIQYAADKAYRTLRVPALEKTYVYRIDETHGNWIANCCLPIPSDLTEFISLIKTEGAGVSTNNPLVYDEKTDYRTFRNTYADRYSSAYWTRFGGNMLLAPFPGINEGDVFELYYYGRLPALDDTYSQEQIDEFAVIGVTGINVGDSIPNWLRDENERVILFGALAEAFAYLGEDDMQAKYLQMYQQEIDELNREEGQRRASGGNVQVHYNSGLI